jgi:hypothetical protein
MLHAFLHVVAPPGHGALHIFAVRQRPLSTSMILPVPPMFCTFQRWPRASSAHVLKSSVEKDTVVSEPSTRAKHAAAARHASCRTPTGSTTSPPRIPGAVVVGAHNSWPGFGRPTAAAVVCSRVQSV